MTTASLPSLDFRVARFDELDARTVYAILQLRQRVFIVEQHTAYLETDGLDLGATHVFRAGSSGSTDIDAYMRIVEAKDVSAPTVRFQRIVAAPELRRRGLGTQLVAKALEVVRDQFDGAAVHIEALSYLESFYANFGFVARGAPYVEYDWDHLPMARAATRRPQAQQPAQPTQDSAG